MSTQGINVSHDNTRGCYKLCVCTRASQPEATVLLIADRWAGASSLWLHMKADWFSSKSRSFFGHKVAAAAAASLHSYSTRVSNQFAFYSKSIEINDRASSGSFLQASWSNIIHSWFCSKPFWPNVHSLLAEVAAPWGLSFPGSGVPPMFPSHIQLPAVNGSFDKHVHIE